MSFKKVVVATTLVLSSSLALADGVSYDYVDLGYINYDGAEDFADTSADGFNFEFSKQFHDNFYGRVEYSDIGLDDIDGDFSQSRLNLGYRVPVAASTDFIAELGYEYVDAEVLGLSSHDDGFNARVGFRSMATDQFELGGYASYSDVFESTDVTVEGRYHFNDQISVALEIGKDEEFDEHYGVSFRYSF